MFWGLLLEPGKRYSTTVEKSFHVSKAALDCSSARTDNEILSVMLETEGSESILCNLCKQKGILQESLDLNFMTGDRLTFECRGHGRVHLTGYLLPDDDDDMSGGLGDEEESEEEDEEESGNNSSEWSTPAKVGSEKKKRKIEDGPPGNPSKKKKEKPNEEGDSDDDEDDDDDDDDESDLSGALDDEDLEEEEDEDDDDKDDDDSEDEEEVNNLSQKQKQQQKQDKNKTPNKQQNLNTPKKTPLANGLTPKDQKSNKKTPAEKMPGEKTPNNLTPKQRLVLDQGVIIKEIKVGNGMPAKSGKGISVHYVGKLKDTGKVFDKQLKGDGFKFKLGKEEVIKGWDIGIQGMKVGGKRVIHCPPEVAYGAKGVPPKIPPNSTLIFEVELKSVN